MVFWISKKNSKDGNWENWYSFKKPEAEKSLENEVRKLFLKLGRENRRWHVAPYCMPKVAMQANIIPVGLRSH